MTTHQHDAGHHDHAAADGTPRAGHGHDHSSHDHSSHGGGGRVTWAAAAQATLHCLTGCAIGEVLGMVIGTAAGLHNAATVVLSIALAFVFGYGLTMRPVLSVNALIMAESACFSLNWTVIGSTTTVSAMEP